MSIKFTATTEPNSAKTEPKSAESKNAHKAQQQQTMQEANDNQTP
jgi:hypothetical protein